MGFDGDAIFKERFESFTGGVLDQFDWAHTVCAGGAVLACLLYDSEYLSTSTDSDGDAKQHYNSDVVSSNLLVSTLGLSFVFVGSLYCRPRRFVQAGCTLRESHIFCSSQWT